jgi:hypothetical protein
VSDFEGSTEGTDESAETDALLSRLRLIEDQPLDSRASAFAQIHGELQSRLESGDSAGPGA